MPTLNLINLMIWTILEYITFHSDTMTLLFDNFSFIWYTKNIYSHNLRDLLGYSSTLGHGRTLQVKENK